MRIFILYQVFRTGIAEGVIIITKRQSKNCLTNLVKEFNQKISLPLLQKYPLAKIVISLILNKFQVSLLITDLFYNPLYFLLR